MRKKIKNHIENLIKEFTEKSEMFNRGVFS